jgi:hypothetical protein
MNQSREVIGELTISTEGGHARQRVAAPGACPRAGALVGTSMAGGGPWPTGHGNSGSRGGWQRPATPSSVGRLWRPVATSGDDGPRTRRGGRSSEWWWLQRRSSGNSGRPWMWQAQGREKRDRVK